ncbi:TrbI/VirB10 family protein (plasmid) [Aliarcobacter lanthieri]|uniref:TrbI/VirB10 family protein n=1 Tax=Aliarcobacter lanthieri TaxID=1355374 RepID=UPI003AAB49B2
MAKLNTLFDLAQKRNVILAVVGGIILILLIASSINDTHTVLQAKKKREAIINEESKIDVIERSIFDIDQSTAIKKSIENVKEELEIKFDEVKKEQSEIIKEIAENQKVIKEQQADLIALRTLNNKEEQTADKKINSEIDRLKEQMQQQKKEFEKLKKIKEVSSEVNIQSLDLPPLQGALADAIIPQNTEGVQPQTFEQFPIPEIKPKNAFFKFSGENIEAEEKKTDDSTKIEKQTHNPMDLMMGLVDAVMVTGVDAPTNIGTKNSDAKDPLPVLLSVSGEALIANSYMQDYKDCLILATATGNATTERAYLRLSKLSCVSKNETTRIEADIEGWVYGEDNKVGVSGFLVTKSGSLILKSLMAGILQGIAESVKNTDNYFETTGTNGRTFSSNAADGFGSGVGSAFKTLADFYIEMAKDLYPVIEVKGGRTVQILMKGAKELKEVPYNKLFINSDYELALNNSISIEY